MALFVIVLIVTILIYFFVIEPLLINPLSAIPGPKLYALTKWRLAIDEWSGDRTRSIDRLHQQYGPVVRIGPNEVHFNSLTALRQIYGPASGFNRTNFYSMFDVYGRQNMFTFHGSKQHGDRKKLLANAYSKSSMMKATTSRMVEEKAKQYLDYIDKRAGQADEIFTSLHYFSIDSIASFLYGPKCGGTSAMVGEPSHRALLGDILDPSRRHLSWAIIHFTAITKWMYTRVGLLEQALQPLLPMQKPATYTKIREHAMKAWIDFKNATTTNNPIEPTIISLLYKHHTSQPNGTLDDLDIASECADHLLAGVDTTADTLMFLLWALSLPQNKKYQTQLIAEVQNMNAQSLNDQSIPTVESADKLPYLNAILKETLRLYAPLPATEPRSLPTSSVIEGYHVPANTVVGMAPYSLHRNPKVFPDPLVFNPERWLDGKSDLTEMNRWFWAFSSGARMCIGMHLAMAEMTVLVAAVYRRYDTRIARGFEGCTPGITSRFEVFYDVTMKEMKEHECWIDFVPHAE